MDERMESRYSAVVGEELRSLIVWGQTTGRIHERDLQILFYQMDMTEETWQKVYRYLESLKMQVIPAAEGGSLFFPTLEELKALYAADEVVLAYLEELEKNGIGHCLTPEQEAECAHRSGRIPCARNTLVEGNLLRVVSVARLYLGQGMIALDLFSEGNRGLMAGAAEWNPDLECPAPVYLIHAARRAMVQALACCTRDLCRIPSDVVDAARMMAEEHLRQNPADLSGVHRLPRSDENTDTFLLGLLLCNAMDKLTPREADVMRMRLGMTDGQIHTMEEVGEAFGITRERVRQIENKVIRRGCGLHRTKRIRDFYS